MKKGDKFVLLALAFVALMIFAVMGYRILTENYAPQGTVPSQIADSLADDSDSASGSQEESADSDPDSLAPDFTVLDMAGNEVNLSDYFGKPIILNFWATWCGPCKSELPAFNNMYEKYKNDVHFLFINLTDGSRETIDGVTQFMEDEGYSFPVYFDTTMEAATKYGAYSIPTTFLIDNEGIPVHSQMGAMPEEAIEQLITTLIDYCNNKENNE